LKKEQLRQLFRVLDWMLTLPQELEESFRTELYHFEEERRMPRVFTIESMAEERGRLEAFHENIALDLEVKFGAADAKLMKSVQKIQDLAQLRSLAKAIKKAATLAEVRALVRQHRT
jgi:hypothetical protein